MIPSKYNINIKDDNNYIIFNILNGKVIKISEKIYNYCLNDELEFYDIFSKEKIKFISNNFFVKSHTIELNELISKFNNMKFGNQTLTLTILTNLDCNMTCKYCHENGFLTKEYIGIETENKILKWLNNQINTYGYKKLIIYYYGGEPLLNMRFINSFSKKVRQLSSIKKIDVDFTLTTNGTLLDDKIVCDLLDNNIRSIQVSIDGDKYIHDKRRQLKNGCSSFDVIMEKINLYKQKLDFTIRCNVDNQNKDRIENLMMYLKENNLNKYIKFYIDFVSQTHNKTSHNNKYLLKNTKEMIYITSLWKKQLDYGLELYGKNIIEGLCGNVNKSNITINPNGDIYICPGLCGIDQLKVGNIDTGFNKLMDIFEKVNIWENCLDCKYLPMCSGGCRAQSYITTGDCMSCYCKKDFYDYAVEKYIKLKYNKYFYENY